MMNEDDTFRMLKRTPFMELFVEFMTTDIPVNDRISFIESHGWTNTEFMRAYRIMNGSIKE